MNQDIIAIGYTAGKSIQVICNDAGLTQLPEPLDQYRDGGGNLHNGALIAWSNANIVALRMMGVLSDNDVSGMLKREAELKGE